MSKDTGAVTELEKGMTALKIGETDRGGRGGWDGRRRQESEGTNFQL